MNVLKTTKTKEKNKWVVFFLCLFLGFLGIHRFYERKILTGLLWCVTLGLWGVGWVIDLILILLRPNPVHPKPAKVDTTVWAPPVETSDIPPQHNPPKTPAPSTPVQISTTPQKKVVKTINLPQKKNGAPLQYRYNLSFETLNNCDLSTLFANEEKEVSAIPSDTGIELLHNGEVFALIADSRKRDMLKDWIKRDDPYTAILRDPGNLVTLAFYRDKRKGNEHREQSVVALTSYKSATKQETLSLLEVGDEVDLEEDSEHDDTVIVSYIGDPIGKLPKKYALKFLNEGAYLAVIEAVEDVDTEDFDTVMKPTVRIYW